MRAAPRHIVMAGVGRPSTSLLVGGRKDVDGRAKPCRDETADLSL